MTIKNQYFIVTHFILDTHPWLFTACPSIDVGDTFYIIDVATMPQADGTLLEGITRMRRTSDDFIASLDSTNLYLTRWCLLTANAPLVFK